jgi:DNA gyrase/topoisomerase IV subunit A
VLLTAINTLMAIDRVIPLPLIRARDAIKQAQQEKQKEFALKLLQKAREELQRSKELGYAGKHEEYAALDNEISSLEKELKGTEETAPLFSRLREKLSSFVQQFSEPQRH